MLEQGCPLSEYSALCFQAPFGDVIPLQREVSFSTPSFNISALGSDKPGVQHREDVGGPFHEIRLVYPPRAFVGKKTNPRLSSASEIIFFNNLFIATNLRM